MSGQVDPAFWRGRRVFLTGHTGFKGAWLALWLERLGARVTGYALPPEEGRPSLFEAAGIAGGIDSRFGDIRDVDALSAAMRAAEPDVVLHLAAQALVRRSYAEPLATYATNVMGTAHLLEACRSLPSVRAVVVVTSDKCYENREWPHAYREPDPMGGHDPYSSSKGCAELVTAAYRASFFGRPDAPAIASARAGNVIGGGDWAEDRLVPDLIRGLGRNEPVPIRSPGATRPWQHVLEPLRGYLVLAERLVSDPRGAAEAWNFGPNDRSVVTVRVLAEAVAREWGGGGGDLRFGTGGDALHEATFLGLDWGKARARLGWSPLLGLEEAVEMTVGWYRRQHEQPARARELCLTQIDDYASRARPS
ncbi:MAG TPA: CDP-glucose 4,6-dehydratase [Gemmatimonadales bacterium]|nr:CDP-glucose 4,6-dehydratase [Gemmatimonadales bacterium]